MYCTWFFSLSKINLSRDAEDYLLLFIMLIYKLNMSITYIQVYNNN